MTERGHPQGGRYSSWEERPPVRAGLPTVPLRNEPRVCPERRKPPLRGGLDLFHRRTRRVHRSHRSRLLLVGELSSAVSRSLTVTSPVATAKSCTGTQLLSPRGYESQQARESPRTPLLLRLTMRPRARRQAVRRPAPLASTPAAPTLACCRASATSTWIMIGDPPTGTRETAEGR